MNDVKNCGDVCYVKGFILLMNFELSEHRLLCI